jgi:AbiV family abortive infection protein
MDEDFKPSQAFLTIRDRCYRHAADLLRSAKRLLGAEHAPHLAYHFAVAALEEIGKVELCGLREAAATRGEDDAFNDKLDDHEQKLFYALWTPSFARQELTADLLASYRQHAIGIHQFRLEGLYVNPDPAAKEPSAAIAPEQAQGLIGLAEARLGLAKSQRPPDHIDDDTKALVTWWNDYSRAPRTRNRILASDSMKKLAELNSVRAWMRWHRELDEQLQAEGRELMAKELARVAPGIDDPGTPKWRMKVRLRTNSHSIRTRPLAEWNEWSTSIKLHSVAGVEKKTALDIDFIFQTHTRIEQLWPMGMGMVQSFLVGLNISTMGFFWWYLPFPKRTFFESITDLETGAAVQVEPPEVIFGATERPPALQGAELRTAAVFFGVTSSLITKPEGQHLRLYYEGLTAIAKCDVQFGMEPTAYTKFADALAVRQKQAGRWDGQRETFASAFRSCLKDLLGSDTEDTRMEIDQHIAIADALLFGGRVARPITLEDVLKMKTFCDACFTLQLTQIARARRDKKPAISRS